LDGFPEDMRAGEDTVVNMALTERGYRTWRAQDVTMIHHSPCATPAVLLRHHFKRGRALGGSFWISGGRACRRRRSSGTACASTSLLRWIPRDLWCARLGDRINAAFRHGRHR
jgi:hypothetical protein